MVEKAMQEVIVPQEASASKRSSILIFGDFMIDKAWIVDLPKNSTSQNHAGVQGCKRTNPSHNDARLGAAGMFTSFLTQLLMQNAHDAVDVYAIGAWNKSDSDLMHTLLTRSVAGAISTTQLLNTPNFGTGFSGTIIKHRYYQVVSNRESRLVARFDQDPDGDEAVAGTSDFVTELQKSLDAIRSLESIKAVVILDFCKGVVTKESLGILFDRLGHISDCIWFVDSKSVDIADMLPAGINELYLSLNRDEVVRLANRISQNEIADIPHGRQPSRELMEALKILKQTPLFSGNPLSRLILKLDCDGACWLSPCDSDFEMHTLKTATREADGVTAGDIFNATLIYERVCKGNKDLSEVVKQSNLVAASWVQFCTDEWLHQPGRDSDVAMAKEINSESFKKLLQKNVEQSTIGAFKFDDATVWANRPLNYELMIKMPSPTVRLADGMGVLGDFILTDVKQRRVLRGFRDVINRYVLGSGRTRPLNCVVAAPPGSGKSFLVGEIGKTTDCEVIEVNCAQVSSPEDFAESVSQVQNVAPNRSPLLFLDEADTDQKLYAQMLTPLWESKIRVRGQLRQWRARCVNILVVSKLKTVEEFRSHLLAEEVRKTSKSADLLSRLNGPTITLAEDGRSSETLTSRVYLLVQKVLQYHPGISSIQRGLLDLVFAAPECNPRAVEYFAVSMATPVSGLCRLADVSDSTLLRFTNEMGYVGKSDGVFCGADSIVSLRSIGYEMPDNSFLPFRLLKTEPVKVFVK